jgi:hypothetical protein
LSLLTSPGTVVTLYGPTGTFVYGPGYDNDVVAGGPAEFWMATEAGDVVKLSVLSRVTASGCDVAGVVSEPPAAS